MFLYHYDYYYYAPEPIFRLFEEGQRTYRPKRCEYNNKKYEDNSPKTLNDKNL